MTEYVIVIKIRPLGIDAIVRYILLKTILSALLWPEKKKREKSFFKYLRHESSIYLTIASFQGYIVLL